MTKRVVATPTVAVETPSAPAPEIITMGNFKGLNRNIFYGYNLVIYRIDDKQVVVSVKDRASIELSDQAKFDEIMDAVKTQGATVTYVPNFDDYFDYKKRLDGYLKDGVLPDTITLTDAEKSANSDLKLAKEAFAKAEAEMAAKQAVYDGLKACISEKFKGQFQRPGLPFVGGADEPGYNLSTVFSGQALAKVRKWLKGETVHFNWSEEPNRSYTFTGNRQKYQLYRVSKSGKRIENLETHQLPVASAQKVAQFALRAWADPANANKTGIVAQSSTILRNYGVEVYKNYVAVGCQHAPRTEIERIAKKLNWIL